MSNIVHVAVTGAAGYFGWQALEANDRYRSATTRAAADRASGDARHSALVADLGFSTGAALVIAGVVVLLVQPGAERSTTYGDAAEPAPETEPEGAAQ